MNILIYKRTHNGDPGEEGIFGRDDCMGRVRNYQFDAVLGIGGKSTWSGSEGLALKINWIGIGPKKLPTSDKKYCDNFFYKKPYRGKLVEFEHFKHFYESGCLVKDVSPDLYEFMFGEKQRRYIFSDNLPTTLQGQVQSIVDIAKYDPRSLELMFPPKDKIDVAICHRNGNNQNKACY